MAETADKPAEPVLDAAVVQHQHHHHGEDAVAAPFRVGPDASGSLTSLPSELEGEYGGSPGGVVVFLRMRPGH